MWDPEELTAIAVRVDALLAKGDPLGEWLALCARLERDGATLAFAERKALRRRARSLRNSLAQRLDFGDDREEPQTHALRERGWIRDVALEGTTLARLERVLARPDASFILRLNLGGHAPALEACVERVLESEPAAHLRQLGLWLELATEREKASFVRRIEARADELGRRLPHLVELEVNGTYVALEAGDDPSEDAQTQAWSAARRTALGRALTRPDPEQRRDALHQLRGYGESVAQLRSSLLQLVEHDPERRVRAAAFALIPQLGPASEAMFAYLVDSAREREDADVLGWLAQIGRG